MDSNQNSFTILSSQVTNLPTIPEYLTNKYFTEMASGRNA